MKSLYDADCRSDTPVCAFDRASPRRATIAGEGGRILVDEPHRPEHATLARGDGTTISLDAPYEVDDFYGEIRHFAGLLLDGRAESDVMPLAASIREAEILDAIRATFARDIALAPFQHSLVTHTKR